MSWIPAFAGMTDVKIKKPRVSAGLFSLSHNRGLGSFDKSDDGEQHHGTDEGGDERADQAPGDEADYQQQITADEGTDDADDDIAE